MMCIGAYLYVRQTPENIAIDCLASLAPRVETKFLMHFRWRPTLLSK